MYAITVSGTIVQQNISIGGSGSSYLYGFMDSQYKDGMTQEECENLVLNGMLKSFLLKLITYTYMRAFLFFCLAISLAIKRDGSSGGVVRLGVLNQTGSIQRKLFLGDKLPKFYDNILVTKPQSLVSGGDASMA